MEDEEGEEEERATAEGGGHAYSDFMVTPGSFLTGMEEDNTGEEDEDEEDEEGETSREGGEPEGEEAEGMVIAGGGGTREN